MKIITNLVTVGTCISAALQQLEATAIKFLVVIDSTGSITGCLTDGDIRRALINGLNISDPVDTIAQRRPITVVSGTSISSIIQKFKIHKIDVLIEVDENRKPLQLLIRDKFIKSIFLSPPHMGSEEADFIQRAFAENFIAPTGSNITDFEQKMTEYSGKKFTLATNTGTAAIHLALRVLDVNQNDRVYCSDYTFAGSAHPILYQLAQPVFIDSDPFNWNMCPKSLEKALTKDKASGMLPKAIIVVHIYGQPANIKELVEIADLFKIPVIEDCAESLGAKSDAKPCGSHGTLAIYSFNGNKIITTSGGGLLASDDESLMQNAKKISSQGREAFYHYEHIEEGYNYRMSNVLAGIGLGQLSVLADRVSKRRSNFKQYVDLLSDIEGISFQREISGSKGNRWLTVLQLNRQVNVGPRAIFEALNTINVECRPAWKPMHMQPLFRTCDFHTVNNRNIVSRDLYFQSVCLPSGSELTTSDIDMICSEIRELIRDR